MLGTARRPKQRKRRQAEQPPAVWKNAYKPQKKEKSNRLWPWAPPNRWANRRRKGRVVIRGQKEVWCLSVQGGAGCKTAGMPVPHRGNQTVSLTSALCPMRVTRGARQRGKDRRQIDIVLRGFPAVALRRGLTAKRAA